MITHRLLDDRLGLERWIIAANLPSDVVTQLLRADGRHTLVWHVLAYVGMVGLANPRSLFLLLRHTWVNNLLVDRQFLPVVAFAGKHEFAVSQIARIGRFVGRVVALFDGVFHFLDAVRIAQSV